MAQQRPNILLIHADQHRFDCLGAYGNPDVRTPNIDALAADGARYENSFCPFPVCTPSRYSLLSSLYVHQHRGWTNHSTLAPKHLTFPNVLRDAGAWGQHAPYRTAAVGKMHFTPTYLDVGFQTMRLAEQDGPGRHDDDYHRWLRAEGLCDRLDLLDQVYEYRHHAPPEYWEAVGAIQSDLDEAHHSTTWIAEQALDVLQTWGAEGNLLMVGFIKPHHPFDPPAPWSQMYNPDELTLLPGWTESLSPFDLAYNKGYFPHREHTEAKIRGAMAMYYATISQIDHHVGRMVAYLKQEGMYDNTMIIYTSDHGDYVGYHHLLLKGHYMYDPVIKVPLIIKYPQQDLAGTVSSALVNNIDVAPTVLRCAGCDVPETMEGRDLRAHPEGREYIFAEGWGGREYMVRSATRKLLLCRDETRSQFFDLERDPLEFSNLFTGRAHQAEVQQMRDALLRWALFDSPSRLYLDERAPVIAGDNVPAFDDGHVEESRAYFRERMNE